MTVEPRMLVGASQLGWVTTLTQWVSEHGGAQLVGQALTAEDVAASDFDLLVVDGWSSLLSRRLVDQVQGAGAAVMVLVNSDRPAAESNRLSDLGVSLSMPVSTSPEQIVARASEVAAVRRFADKRTDDPPASSPQDDGDRHKIMALLGQDGVTEVAVNLAAAVARSGESTVLADFDTVEPSIAQRLDLPIVPNLLTVSDHIRRGRFDEGCVTSHPDGFAVIPGLANPREWAELTSVDAGDVAAELKDHYDLSLIVVHRIIEDVAPLSGLQGRFDVGRRIIERADQVMVVASASPVGLVRALHRIADVRTLTAAPIHVVVNRTPADGFVRAEWARELERTFTPASLSFLPFDKSVPKAAWDGRLPVRGPFVREVRSVGSTLVRDWAA